MSDVMLFAFSSIMLNLDSMLLNAESTLLTSDSKLLTLDSIPLTLEMALPMSHEPRFAASAGSL